MFKKRALAMVLAFTFIIGCVPNLGLTDVYGVEENPHLLQKEVLSIGNNNDTPTLDGAGQPKNAFMFGWDASIDNESSTLEYWVENNTQMVVNTTRVGKEVTVDIQLKNSSGVINVNDSDYSIYNNSKKTYLTVDKYFDSGTGAPSTAYNDYDYKAVLGTSRLSLSGPSTSARFMLNSTGNKAGYSISYKGYELHFLLDSEGYFRFYQVGGFTVGRVYDTLFTKVDTDGVITTFNRAFSIGLDLDKVSTDPFVDYNNQNTTLSEEYKNEKYIIEDRGLVSVDGDDSVGFNYSIPLPREYKLSSNNFTQQLTKEAIFTVLFKKGSTSSSTTAGNYISATIVVPAGGGVPQIKSSTLEKGTITKCSINNTTNPYTLDLTFEGLDSGMLLTPEITFKLEDAAHAVVKDYGTPDKKAYTFPEYEIINNDGQDYVSITPFAGYAGDYVLYSATSEDPVTRSNFKFASKYYKENATSKDKIWLPLSPVLSATDVTNYDYKIFFNPNGPFSNAETIMNNETTFKDTVQTRYFQYTAKDRGAIGFPNNFTVTNVNQSKMFVHDDTLYTQYGKGNYVENFQDTSYTMAWDLGKVTSIDKMLSSSSAIVEYNLNIGKEIDVVEDDFLNIEFNIEGSSEPGKATLNATTPFKATFNITEGKTPKTPLNNVIAARMTTVYSTQSSAYVYRLEIDLENVAIDAEKTADNVAITETLYFQYPNIYFFTVSPVLGSDSESVKSTVKSLTLNKDVSVELKEPIKVRTSNIVTQFKGETDALGQTIAKDQVSIDLTYEQQQATLVQYMNYYFTNYDLINYGQNMKFTNDIYISQDYKTMIEKFPDYTKAQRDAATVSTAIDFTKNLDPSGNYYTNSAGAYVVMMRAFENNTTDPKPLETSTGQLGVDVLRAGGVLRIDNVPMTIEKGTSYTLPTSNIVNTLQVNGLDTNAKYYFYVDTSVIYDASGHHRYINQNKVETDILEDDSSISALAAGTTGSSLAKPSILDEVPVMPEISLLETGRNNYKMTWENVNMTISDTTRYSQEFQYEVLRVRDTKLEDKYLDSRQDLQKVFANQIDSSVTDKSAQLLYKDPTSGDPAVLLYNPTKNTFETPSKGMYVQTYDEDNIIYEDNSLSANKVYFVYARTVRVITEKDADGKVIGTYKVYSPWDALSATTALGEPPVDLRVVYNYTGVYNDQTQIPLSFRAKVPDVAAIGKDFTFQVTYKFDGNEWVVPITIDSATLKNTNNYTDIDAEGYRTFTFLLSGLTPGKAYSIKVRQANSDGSYTPYSNVVQWKTEIDEDEYDKEDELDSYEDLMDDLVDRIIDGSQIELTNNSKEKVIMINGNNLSNEISDSQANTILMNVLDKGKKNTLIIPFEAYETASDKNLGWQFSYKDMFFNMSANTIDPTYNENVIAMNKKVDRDFVDDYYMEIIFEYRGTPTTLQGDDRLTDVVNISSNLRATKENVLDFQEYALKETLEEVRNSDLAEAKKAAVLKSIATGMSSEYALKLVDEYVEYVRSQFKSSFNAKLYAIRQARDDESVYSLDKNMIMGTNYQNLLSSVTAYNVNTYAVALPLPTTRSTNVTTAVVKNFGTYGFGGDAVNIVGTIDNQNGNNNISEIIATNDLEDTLSGVGSTVDTNANISISQAIIAMGNIAGMTDTEMKTVLSDNGISINRNNETKNLTEDLSAAMLAVLYEEVNGVNPDSVTIKDYNFYNSLKSSGISEGYIKHIQLAKEMGLITNLPSTSNTVTVGKFLGILSKI